MASVDALSFADSQVGGARRWAAGIAFAVAIHGALFVYLNRSPAPVAFDSQVPVELDLMPPPEGAAQMDQAGENETTAARPEEAPPVTDEPEQLPEIDAETPPPPPETETVAAEEPQELEEINEPVTAETEVQPDVVETPPDVEAAVTLPPQDTVVAQDVIEPPKPKPPVAKRPDPKPEPKREPPRREIARERPKPEAKPAERRQTAQSAQQAGGRGGATSDPGAARAAAAAFQARITSLIRAQHKCSPGVNGKAVIRFTVNRAGRVTAISTASGSGAMAAQALSEVRRASGSFPSMPAEMDGSSKTFTAPISSSGC